MATVLPFRALRYAPERVALEKVLTQPYDKITPEMQDRYYAADPHNLVRVILGKRQAGDGVCDGVYARAASHLQAWQREGVLAQDPQPGFYIYSQCFSDAGGRVRERRGFIALCKLEDYRSGVVLRHEQTHSAPKADRLNLLRATRTHAESIFVLYSDPERRVDALLAAEARPEADVTDEYQVGHRLWAVTDQARVSALISAMMDKKLIIADGHHRYETALTYRDERRAKDGKAADAPYEYMLMTFVAVESDGLVILPTHRVLSSLPSFEESKFFQKLTASFELREIADLNRGLGELQAQAKRIAFLVATRNGLRLASAQEHVRSALAHLSPALRELDVAVLHEFVFAQILGLTEQDIRELKHIAYLRDAREAVQQVDAGANVAFVLNPARVEQVRDIAIAGDVMPQKSTDFYPKLLSGLVMYALD